LEKKRTWKSLMQQNFLYGVEILLFAHQDLSPICLSRYRS